MVIHSNCFGIGDIVQVEYPDIKVSINFPKIPILMSKLSPRKLIIMLL